MPPAPVAPAATPAVPLADALPAATDVLIVGGGVMGCSLAYFLAGEGVETTLIERADINAQASGTNAGSLHAQILSHIAVAEDEAVIAASMRPLRIYAAGIRTWTEFASDLDTDIEVATRGGLMVAETEAQVRILERKVERELKAGLEVELVSGNRLRTLAPYLSDAVIAADFCPIEGKVNPIRATPAIARAAQRRGAHIVRGAGLLALERTGGGFEARTARGTIRAKRVVNAAGGWAGEVARLVGLDLPVRRRALHMNATEPTEQHIPHLVQHIGRRLTMKQSAAGTMLLGGGWPAWMDTERDRGVVQHTSILHNLWIAQHLAPALGQLRLLRTWSGLINVMVDGNPILGPVAKVPGFYVACSSVGYTASPACARLLSEVLTGRQPSLDIQSFAVDRFEAGAPIGRSPFTEGLPAI